MKNLKSIAILLLLLTVSVNLMSCSDNDDDKGGAKKELVGIWADANELQYALSGHPDYKVFAIQLNSNGTGRDGEWIVSEQKFYGEDYTWKWWVDEEDLLCIKEEGEEATSMHYSIVDENNAIIDGDTYVRVK